MMKTIPLLLVLTLTRASLIRRSPADISTIVGMFGDVGQDDPTESLRDQLDPDDVNKGSMNDFVTGVAGNFWKADKGVFDWVDNVKCSMEDIEAIKAGKLKASHCKENVGKGELPDLGQNGFSRFDEDWDVVDKEANPWAPAKAPVKAAGPVGRKLPPRKPPPRKPPVKKPVPKKKAAPKKPAPKRKPPVKKPAPRKKPTPRKPAPRKPAPKKPSPKRPASRSMPRPAPKRPPPRPSRRPTRRPPPRPTRKPARKPARRPPTHNRPHH